MRFVFAESTKASYKTHAVAYLRFCKYYDCVPVPACQQTLVGYVVFLSRSLKPSSIKCYLNIIRILHVCAGFKNPLENNWEVSMLFRAISRCHGTPPVQKTPISIPMLLSIHKKLSFACKFDIVFLGSLYGRFLRVSAKVNIVVEVRISGS